MHDQELDDVKRIKDEKDKLNAEKETLEKDIIELSKENISKEEILLAIKVEMKMLQDKLLKIKETNVGFDDKNVQTD